MKKKKKAYFSKTFIYLALVIAAVAGFFLMVNYATNQQLSMNSEAAGEGKCEAYSRSEYDMCSGVKSKSKDVRIFTTCIPKGKANYSKYIYCKAGKMPAKGDDCRQAAKEAKLGSGDWYSESAVKQYKDEYTFTKVYGVSTFYQNQHPNRTCYVMKKKPAPTKKPNPKNEWQ